MTMVPGYAVTAWAGEPMIAAADGVLLGRPRAAVGGGEPGLRDEGRGFSNAGTSRILILEDTNRDGVADSRKVFMEGIVFPVALAVGFDGVFVGAPPNLLFVPDRDGDDKADMSPTSKSASRDGASAIATRSSTASTGDPDGWLYGLQGFATPSKVQQAVGQGPPLQAPASRSPRTSCEGDGVEINGGVWRYHPTQGSVRGRGARLQQSRGASTTTPRASSS